MPGRWVILADIHSNLEALEAVLADAQAQGPFDGLWCLGDIVGYGPNPNECVSRLREYPLLCIAGNHDWAAIGKLGTGEFNPYAASAAHWTANHLTPESRAFLATLPLMCKEGDFTLAHGSPREPIWEYLLDPWEAAANFRHFDSPYCLVGHTHLPTIFLWSEETGSCRQLDFPDAVPLRLGPERLIINPGSVGQPRNGDPLASYALYDNEQGTLQRRRVPYPLAVTQEKIRRAGLPTRLADRLAYGW